MGVGGGRGGGGTYAWKKDDIFGNFETYGCGYFLMIKIKFPPVQMKFWKLVFEAQFHFFFISWKTHVLLEIFTCFFYFEMFHQLQRL